jgi:suppressor of ftsI
VPGRVKFRVRFQEFTGKTVYHCHITPHEDTGMMQNILMT